MLQKPLDTSHSQSIISHSCGTVDAEWRQTLHDLRDALYSIRCGIELFTELDTLDAKQRRWLMMMRDDQANAQRLVQRLADQRKGRRG